MAYFDTDRLNALGGIVVDAALAVHKELGPGLLESAYELALARELELREIECKRQVPIDLYYKGISLEKGFQIDMLVEGEIVIEIKATEELLPVHKAQLLTYLKLANKKLGYLITFNTPLLKDGIRRIKNGY